MTIKDSIAAPTAPSLSRVSDYAQWYAQRTPEAVALVLGEQRVTYRSLSEDIDLLAKALIKAGVKKGDRVATLCPPSPDYFRCFLATASIGGIWVGLNPLYQTNELSYVTGDCEPVVLLSRTTIDGEKICSKLKELKKVTPSLKSFVTLDETKSGEPEIGQSYQEFISSGSTVSAEELHAARENCGGRDPCLIVYTSGSTGSPKGALLHHEGIVELSLEQNRTWPVSPMRVLNYFPVNHIGCVIDISTPVCVAGGTIVFMEKFLPRKSLEIMESEKITLWGSVPSVFYLQFAEDDIASFDFSSVQLIVWEGAALSLAMINVLLQYNVPLATNYGMSESCGAIAITDPIREISILEKTVGHALKGVEIRLVDNDGKPVNHGETGEVLVRSKYNMLGYWNRPEATKEALSEEGWLSTGDLAHQNSDGSYSIRGRTTEMYKSGGYNVYPREVEDVIERFEGVIMAAVVFVNDPIWQEVGVAYVCSSEDISLDALLVHCRSMLAKYKVPKNIVIMNDLPILPIGKVDKVKLKNMATNQFVKEP